MRKAGQDDHSALRMSVKVLVVGLSVNLAGCGNSDISSVKKMTLTADQTYTIGQVFDNRKACDSTKWSESTDDRGRKIVEYRCDFGGVAEYGESYTAYFKKNLQSYADTMKNSYAAAIPEDQKSVNFDSAQVARYQNEINSPDTVQSLVQKNPQFASLSTVELQTTIQQTLESAKDNLPIAQKTLQNDQEKLNQAIAGKDQYFATMDKKLSDKLGQLDGLGLKSASEVYQWAIPEDGDPTLIYAGEEITLQNGQTKSVAYDAMTQWAVKNYINNNAKNYGDYVKGFGMANIFPNVVQNELKN